MNATSTYAITTLKSSQYHIHFILSDYFPPPVNDSTKMIKKDKHKTPDSCFLYGLMSYIDLFKDVLSPSSNKNIKHQTNPSSKDTTN